MLIIKQEKVGLEYKKTLEDFGKFQKDWQKETKAYITKLFDFREFKNKKGINLGLDFRYLSAFEIPNIADLKDLKYVYSNKNVGEKEKYIFKNIKLIYSFSNYSFNSSREIKKEIEDLYKREKDLTDAKYNKILSNIFLEIPVEDSSEEELFKSVVFIRKILINFLGDIRAKKVKILLKNDFSKKINEEILNNKLLKINGIII